MLALFRSRTEVFRKTPLFNSERTDPEVPHSVPKRRLDIKTGALSSTCCETSRTASVATGEETGAAAKQNEI